MSVWMPKHQLREENDIAQRRDFKGHSFTPLGSVIKKLIHETKDHCPLLNQTTMVYMDR